MSFARKIKNNFLTGHLGVASSESISAKGSEIFINNTPAQQSFQKLFYLLSYIQFRGVFRTLSNNKVWLLSVNYLRKPIHP